MSHSASLLHRIKERLRHVNSKTYFSKACSNCSSRVFGEVYFTDEVIRDVLLSKNQDIRRDVLSMNGIIEKSITEVIALIESRETAGNANLTITSISTLSEYCRPNCDNARQPKKPPPSTCSESSSPFNQSIATKYPKCTNIFSLYTKWRAGWNCCPYTQCETCWKKRAPKQTGTTGSISRCNDNSLGQISTMNLHESTDKTAPKILDHQIFFQSNWRQAKLTKHLTVTLQISPDVSSKASEICAAADTRAQSNTWSLDAYIRAGFKTSDLFLFKRCQQISNQD